jgi:hypothetical protein
MSGTKIKKYVLRDQIEAELKTAGITEAPRLDSHNQTPGDDNPSRTTGD